MVTLVSGRPVDPEEARQLMLRNGCRPKTEFLKAKESWPSTCGRCGADIYPTYDSIASKARRFGDAPRGCRDCADRALAEKFRLDEAELAKTIALASRFQQSAISTLIKKQERSSDLGGLGIPMDLLASSWGHLPGDGTRSVSAMLPGWAERPVDLR